MIGSDHHRSVVGLSGNKEGGKVIASGGEACGASGNYTAEIELLCDRAVGGKPTLVFSSAPSGSGCTYLFNIQHSLACRPGTPAAVPPKKKGLSGGSIILILALVILVLYCGAGISYNVFKKNESGLDVIPNYAFWVSLPGLVLDGLKFTYAKITGSQSMTSYDSI